MTRTQACTCDGRPGLLRIVLCLFCRSRGSIVGVQRKSGRRLQLGSDRSGGKENVTFDTQAMRSQHCEHDLLDLGPRSTVSGVQWARPTRYSTKYHIGLLRIVKRSWKRTGGRPTLRMNHLRRMQKMTLMRFEENFILPQLVTPSSSLFLSSLSFCSRFVASPGHTFSCQETSARLSSHL